MISTKEAEEILIDSGIEVIKKPDPDNILLNRVYIGNEIVWDKLIQAMRSIDVIREEIDSIPHLKTLQAILNKYNPKLEIITIEDDKGNPVKAYGIAFKEIVNKEGKVPRLDKCFHYLFYIIQWYITPLFEPFEKMDQESGKNSSN